MARTPARPDGANLEPPAHRAGGFFFRCSGVRPLFYACGGGAIPSRCSLTTALWDRFGGAGAGAYSNPIPLLSDDTAVGSLRTEPEPEPPLTLT